MNYVLLSFAINVLLILCYSCQLKESTKKEIATVLEKGTIEKKMISVVEDKRVFEMKISKDTFPASSKKIPIIIINHLANKATFGDDFSLEYYNKSSSSWEDALPENLVHTLLLHEIQPHSQYNYHITLFSNKPGRYKVTKIVTSLPYCNIVIGEFVLSATLK